MRVLVAVLPGAGHLNPLLPLAGALRDAGHQVRFATSAPFGEDVRRAGFDAVPVGRPWLLNGIGAIFPGIDGLKGDERTAWVYRHAFTGPLATEAALDMVRLQREEPYDVLVGDAPFFGAVAAAAVVGVPAVGLAIASLSVHVEYLEKFAPELDALWRSVGLTPVPTLQVAERQLMLSPVPADVFFGDVRLPRTLREVRMESYESDQAPPEWLASLPDRPTVYATLGTIQNREPRVFRTILEGLDGEDLNLVMTTGQDQDPAEVGPVPANGRVERFIPQATLLPHCSAAINHAGSGSLRAAAWFGLPQVLLPFAADQPLNAAIFARQGLALTLDRATMTPDQVRQAVRTVLDDPGYRERAAAASRRMRELPGVEAAVALVEGLV